MDRTNLGVGEVFKGPMIIRRPADVSGTYRAGRSRFVKIRSLDCRRRYDD